MNIDCDTCEVKGKACGDCFVSFLTIPVRAAQPVVMDEAQRRAVDVMVAGGLVPPLRLSDAPRRRRAG
ncbi:MULTISPECIES: hypothetical protein [Demequina]|uniref:Uncharacterized protein n=1 Tax=Demequina litorisediminis TaxID=1849022 RepID=A0ABQ6I7Z3_9MICO|nr:hypothetical protein [Demequina litorisediminis]GMA33968.1 hypothetical protein GCM10025876_01720 [Demequina litorisediminis]